MIRSMQKSPTPLSITRQSIQDIWHVACQTEVKSVLGLLGASSDGVISHIQHVNHLDKTILKSTSDIWAKDGVFVQGVFQSKPLSIQSVQNDQGLSSGKTWVYLLLNIDTQGCLKSTLHYLEKNEILELPMTLVDHGQSPLKG